MGALVRNFDSGTRLGGAVDGRTSGANISVKNRRHGQRQQISLANPTGTAQNDLPLATISTRGGTVTAPAGWTEIQQQTQGSETLAVFYLRYNANTPDSHISVFQRRYGGRILRYTGGMGYKPSMDPPSRWQGGQGHRPDP